mgnify:FL=1
MKEKKQYVLVIMLILSIIIIDQVVKFCVILNQPIEIGTSVIRINYIEQEESNVEIVQVLSSIFADLLVILILTRFLLRQIKNMNVATKIAIAFVLGGAISNVIDRFIRGRVIKYINISGIINSFPVFNIAHIFIVVGFVIFVITVGIDLIKMRPREEKTNFGKKDTSKSN